MISKVKAIPESFEDFSQRFQLAQLLSKGKKGIIFIGNTRAGKTTLCCAAAGATIKIKYDSKKWLTYLEPSGQKYSDLVKDTNESVTEMPNFFIKNHTAIIDMPGYADNSRFKQLINFHYIRKMVTNLQEIAFFIVLTLSYGDGKYQIQGAQRKMLQNFQDTFPQCKGCVSVIINRAQHNNVSNRHNQAEALKGAFRHLLVNPQNARVRRYFEKNAVNKFHVFFRPPYRENNSGTDWDESHPTISQQISDICFNQNLTYLNISKINTNRSIFKGGDNTQNQRFKELLSNILKQQSIRAEEVKRSYQSILFFLIKGFVQNSLANQQDSIEQVLDILLTKDIKVDRKQDRSIDIDHFKTNLTMVQSRLIKLYLTLTEIDSSKIQDKVDKQIFTTNTINNAMGQIIWIIHQAYPYQAQLLKKMKAMHNYFIRRFQQTFFIQTALVNQKIVDAQILKDFIETSIYSIAKGINKLQQQKIMKQMIKDFQKLAEGVLSLNLKTKFANNFNQAIKEQLIQMLKALKILNDKSVITNDNDKILKTNQKILQKIDEVQLYYLIIYVPNPNKPEQIKNSANNLLLRYHLAQTKQNKFKLSLKIATNFSKNEQKHHAIALFLHLEIFEQALRIVESILDPKKVEPKKVEIVLKWYQQMAEFFKSKKKIYYFERCIQKAKTLCLEDIQTLINLQRIKEQGLQAISQLPKKDTSMLKKQNNGQKLQYWQWDKIDEEIQFLKVLCKLENKKKDWKVIGAKFRQ